MKPHLSDGGIQIVQHQMHPAPAGYVHALANLTEAALLEYCESILEENGAGRYSHLSDREFHQLARGVDWSQLDPRHNDNWAGPAANPAPTREEAAA